MIEITLVMHGVLRRFVPEGKDRMAYRLPEGTTVSELIESLEAQDDVWCVAINGTVAKVTATLSAGDVLDCFEPLEGG